MSLPMRTELTNYGDSSDLDTFVEEVYGKEFNFVADQEVGNDSSVTFSVSAVSMESLHPTKVKDFNDFIDSYEGISYLLAGNLLNDLCFKDLIPAGKYVISVCW